MADGSVKTRDKISPKTVDLPKMLINYINMIDEGTLILWMINKVILNG